MFDRSIEERNALIRTCWTKCFSTGAAMMFPSKCRECSTTAKTRISIRPRRTAIGSREIEIKFWRKKKLEPYWWNLSDNHRRIVLSSERQRSLKKKEWRIVYLDVKERWHSFKWVNSNQQRDPVSSISSCINRNSSHCLDVDWRECVANRKRSFCHDSFIDVDHSILPSPPHARTHRHRVTCLGVRVPLFHLTLMFID